MWIYILLPLGVFYELIIQRLVVVRNHRIELVERYRSKKNSSLSFWFVILLMIATFKGITVGTDSLMYFRIFKNSTYSEMEPAIHLLYKIAQKVDEFLVFQLFIYFTFLFFIFKGIQKQCPNYLIAILMFILTFTYFTSFNQIRQIVAVAIIFYFIYYLISQKINKIKFIVVILFAMLFHKSAIFLLFLLLVYQKRLNPRMIIILFITTIILYFTPQVKNIFGGLLIDFSNFYESKYEGNLNFFFLINKEKGIVQVLPIAIQMLIIIISYNYPRRNVELAINYRLFDFVTNILIINLALYSLSGIEAIDRLQVYLSVFNIYFYSLYLHQLLNDSHQYLGKILSVIIIIFWTFYYVLRLLNNNQGIVPFIFF